MSFHPKLLTPDARRQKVLFSLAGDWGGLPCEWFFYLAGVYCRVRTSRWGSVLEEGFFKTPWPIWAVRKEWETHMNELIAKALGKQEQRQRSYKAAEDTVLKPYPVTAAFLTFSGDAKGPKRETATLNVSYGPNGFTVMLKDRELSRIAFGNGESLTAAWTALEASLTDGTVVWREDGFAKRPRGK